MRKPDHLVAAEKQLKKTAIFLEVNDKLDLEDLYGVLDEIKLIEMSIKDRIGELRGESV